MATSLSPPPSAPSKVVVRWDNTFAKHSKSTCKTDKNTLQCTIFRASTFSKVLALAIAFHANTGNIPTICDDILSRYIIPSCTNSTLFNSLSHKLIDILYSYCNSNRCRKSRPRFLFSIYVLFITLKSSPHPLSRNTLTKNN